MEDHLKKFRDCLRIMIILYTFCDPLEDKTSGKYGVFRSEIKIQALDFLLRYPDFLSISNIFSTSSTFLVTLTVGSIK